MSLSINNYNYTSLTNFNKYIVIVIKFVSVIERDLLITMTIRL